MLISIYDDDKIILIINFITQADSEFVRLEEKAKEIDKIKKVINISNIK